MIAARVRRGPGWSVRRSEEGVMLTITIGGAVEEVLPLSESDAVELAAALLEALRAD